MKKIEISEFMDGSDNICKVRTLLNPSIMKKGILLSWFLISFFSFQIKAQNNFGSEEELKKKAESLFIAENYAEANPMFAQLLSLYPKDPNYNYKYGACVLFSEADKEKPIKFLEFAAQSPSVDPIAHYFLGKAYHLNYNFAKAVKQYSKYSKSASSEEKKKYEVDRQIEMCKNGNTLLSRFNEVQVLNKQEISRKDFFRIYDLQGINGKIIAKPNDFKSKYDLKMDDKSVIFLPDNAKEVYYSSYGKKGENGRDIFKVIKIGNGGWSEPVNIGNSINTPFDEDYAFIHPDGRTLYFASKGHNSMGGYDLFVSTYDDAIKDWTAPINLDFAFSSVDDDIMFVTDANKVLAYFASSRSNSIDKINVYKVLVSKEPAQISIITGKFIAENNPGQKAAKITVIDQANNETIGVYETDENGNYQVEFNENGGSYQFNIETGPDAPIHSGIVNVPKQEEFEVLGQELRLVGEGDNQQLVIKNIFDGTAAANLPNSGPIISSDMLRRKASLEVNSDESNIDLSKILANAQSSSGNDGTNQSTNVTSGPVVSGVDDIEKLNNKTNQLQELVKKSQEENSQAMNLAYQEANKLKDEAELMFAEAETKEEDENKESMYLDAKRTALLGAYSTQFARSAEQNLKKSNALNDELIAVKTLLESGSSSQAQDKLNSIEKKVDGQVRINDMLSKEKLQIQKELQNNLDKLAVTSSKINAIQKEQVELKIKIDSLEIIKSSGSVEDVTELENQIKGFNLDSEDMEYQIVNAQKKYESIEQTSEAQQTKLEQLENFESNWNDKENLTISELDPASKEALIEKMTYYRDNDMLAFNQGGENESFTKPILADGNSSSSNAKLSPEVAAQQYSNELAESKSITDTDSRNARQLSIYNDWIKSTENNIAAKEVELNQEQDAQKQENIRNEITQLNSKLNELNALKSGLENQLLGGNAIAGNSNSGINNNQQINSSINTSNNSSNSTISSDKGTPKIIDTKLGKVDVSSVNENSIIPDEYTSIQINQEFIYTSKQSNAELALAKKAFAEAATYGKAADDSRNNGYTLGTVEERNKAFELANEFQNASLLKQIEVEERFALINAAEFKRNSDLIESSENYGESFESNNLDIANLIIDEASVYFNNAQEIRASISPEADLSSKQTDLQEAYNLEMLAINKQKEAQSILKIVDTEYQANPISSYFKVNEANLSSSEEDLGADVMAINNSFVAKNKGDSLMSIAAGLDAKIIDLKAQMDAETDPANKDAILIELSKIEDEKIRLIKKADSFYLRAKQLDSVSTGLAANILKPTSTELAYQGNTAESIEIPEERKQELLNNPTYSTYLDEVKKRAKAVNSAKVEYEKAIGLVSKREQLIKEAIVIRQNAANSADESEKQRLIKSAEVIDQRVLSIDASLDSINNVIKINNLMISTAEQKIQGLLSNLSNSEQQEFIALSAEQVESEMALAENTPNESSEKTFPVGSNSDAGVVNPEKLVSGNTTADNNSGNLANESTASNEPNTSSKPIKSAPAKISGQNKLSTIDVIPRKVESTIFLMLSPQESAYSDAKPIPVNPEMPEGLVYKVQIGAFRNPIPQDLFKGFAPLMAEKIPSGITRYTAGVFVGEREANAARDEIRGFGYADAFVVAFLNGKRVNIAESRKINPASSNALADNSPVVFESTSSESNRAGTETNNAGGNGNSSSAASKELPASFNASNVAAVKNVNDIKEVFFTVQIGVFSKPIPNGVFDNYSDLNVLVLPNGLIRYNTGVFTDITQANSLKESIVGNIKDAFVTAYYQGKRITIAEAARIMNQN